MEFDITLPFLDFPWPCIMIDLHSLENFNVGLRNTEHWQGWYSFSKHELGIIGHTKHSVLLTEVNGLSHHC